MSGGGATVLVVSQPNTAVHNQLVYARLAELGWDVKLIVPARWKDQYSGGLYAPQRSPAFSGTFARVRVINPGPVQRHVYATRPSRWLERYRPVSVFLEQEPFSLSGLQWGTACERRGVPWGLQGDENLDRPFPWPAKVIRAWTVRRARYFAARSPTAADMLRRWGARAPIGVVPHTIPEWDLPPRTPGPVFTVGYAGRLVPEKGIDDLLAACRALAFPFRLLVVGDGELRARVEAADLGPHGTIEVRTGLLTDGMTAAYREMDALVLPSRTTETWAEQFGKVLCEALLCGVPVVGSDSGEIPWVVETSGGGLTFPEGDPAALAERLAALHADAPWRGRLAAAGREGVLRHFAPIVAARELDALIRRTL